MNPFLARIASLSKGKALVIGLVVTGLYYVAMYDDGAKPRKAIVDAKKELEVEREKEKETDRALARRSQLEQSFNALSEQFQIVSSQIPANMDSAEVIRTVDTMAKTSGITIKSKEPKASQREDILEAYPIRVTAEGSYSEMTMFFFNLSTIERVYRVRAFTFQVPDDKKTPGRKMTMDAEISSFKFVGPEPEDAKKKKPKPRKSNRK
jgi:type IV pilus assembly protein PilO